MHGLGCPSTLGYAMATINSSHWSMPMSLYCTVPNCTVQYCTAVYSTVPYSTILTYVLPVWCLHCCSLQLMKSISDKHEEVMARMGSIMAAGILDAGALRIQALGQVSLWCYRERQTDGQHTGSRRACSYLLIQQGQCAESRRRKHANPATCQLRVSAIFCSRKMSRDGITCMVAHMGLRPLQ
jgi:hypothetical protein